MEFQDIQLAHAAISIKNVEEIEAFYARFLGFQKRYDFKIDADRSNSIFGIKKEIEVIVIENPAIRMEVFVLEETPARVQHLCFEMKLSQEWLQQAESSPYWQSNFKNSSGNQTVFLKDQCGNLFEIKGV
jgi:extradiol dioxygenase family protein